MRGMDMNKPLYRHEEKYLISYTEYAYLSRLLSSVLKKDSHASEDGDYFIRSLYFDTLQNHAFDQKESGILERRKIRLRIYDTQTRRVSLEIKNKSGFGIYKESAKLSRESTDELLRGNYDTLLQNPAPTARRVYHFFKTGAWRPAVLIDYEREAYVMPVFQVRITFDKHVRAHLGEDGFFEKNTPMLEAMDRDKMILEVKYNNVLPGHVKAMISTARKQPMPISKYCMSRSLVG